MPTFQVVLDEETSGVISAALANLQRQYSNDEKEAELDARLRAAVAKNDFAAVNKAMAERKLNAISSRLTISAVIRAYVKWAIDHGIKETEVVELIKDAPGRGRPRVR